ncbi:hypothetical protein GCM10008927_17390 [Amylibacter ulvae]|uniref:Uncharacterized protein n=1 Tax=Paramylibacter ulvae TaxID=1651968 RepID=A0ABQ3D1P8_9RHOB|nr:hypothetical protein [Amylibacter ulvae]GHA52452.1 hypothetical protein GCM10008927_17390 [Amylibacter ulvae]
MNRRQFTLALGAAAVMPNISIATPSGVTKTLGAKSAQYAHLWGRGIAQARPDITAKTLTSILQIPQPLAQDVMRHLVKTNVVTAANAQGVYQTIRPDIATMNRTSLNFDTTNVKKLANRIIADEDGTKTALPQEPTI